MSKRSEEAAIKAYPINIQATRLYGDWDINSAEREGFVKGYEQAEKDTIERAISWLKEHANDYIVDIGVGYGENGRNVELIVGGMCWEHLKKAMEDEE